MILILWPVLHYLSSNTCIRWLWDRLTIHVWYQVLDSFKRTLTVCFAFEVNRYETAYLHMRMGKEGIEEKRKLSASKLKPLLFEVSPESFLWEIWCSICAGNVLLHHGLELTYGRVSISNVERDIFWTNNLDEVRSILIIHYVILNDRDFEVYLVLTGCLRWCLFYHYLLLNWLYSNEFKYSIIYSKIPESN